MSVHRSTVRHLLAIGSLVMACSPAGGPVPSGDNVEPGKADPGDLMDEGDGASGHGGANGPNTDGSSTADGGRSAGAGGANGDLGAPNAAGGSAAGGAPAGGGDSSSPFLPARIRRLTNAEYDASVQELLQTSRVPSEEFSFPPDARQGPANAPAGPAFTSNDAQRVDPVLASRLDTAALALVAEARASGKLAEFAPCSDPVAEGEACAREFLRSFGARAYRRPLTDEEVDALVSGPSSAYHVGADGYSYEEGIDTVTRVLLQSPGFLYITELGADGAGSGAETVQLTDDEIATQLAYLLTAAPPDADLLAEARAGQLASSEARVAAAERLLASPTGRERLVRVVQEWLGLDGVTRREKSTNVYPEFADVSPAMAAESYAFIDEVLHRSTGTLSELLTADWTIASQPLADLYGVPWGGEGERTSLAGVGRRGILNQGAFLSVFATNNGSHPVFRGVAIVRRLACIEIPDPGELGLVVSFPASDESRTTRERFEVHATDPSCAACHATIDAFGFTLENFDGIGRMRENENNDAVDTSVTLSSGTDIDGAYADSNELLLALAQSDEVKTCLARQLFRSSAARSNDSVAGAEAAFVEIWRGLPAERQDRLVDVLLTYVGSPAFIQRSVQ